MKKINIGIIGYGKMGKIRENSFLSSDDVKLISIFDLNYLEQRDDVIVCESLDELLNSGIDAVFISSYVNTNAEYTIKSLEANKHVFCEKPPAMNSKEMIEVSELFHKKDLILKYGFNHRYHYSAMEAKKIIDSGNMGKLLWMRGVYGKAGSIDFDKEWRNYKKYSGGGILMDQGIHMIDLFRFFSNQEFECVNSHVSTEYWNIENEDNAFLLLKSKEGIIASMHSTANQWRHKFLLEMTFEKGYVNLDGLITSTGSYAPEKLIYGFREFEDIHTAMGKPSETISYFEIDNSWLFELDEFISAVKGQGEIINGTISDATEIISLIDDIYSDS
ncbi:MAG: oxidoreductase [Flavobacteriales bacterium]|nr:oxidoreductase [Flavobacteriales bacterium]